jgi:hypothetical protein
MLGRSASSSCVPKAVKHGQDCACVGPSAARGDQCACLWIGLFTGDIGWLVALVWAKTKPLNSVHELAECVSEMESRIEQLEGES